MAKLIAAQGRSSTQGRERATRMSRSAPEAMDLASRKSAKRKQRAPLREIGAPGTVFVGGFLQFKDLNPDWRNLRKRCEIVMEMRTTDPQIQAILLACKMPILTCQWHVSAPPKKPTALEKEIAQFCQDNLFGMTMPWAEVLSQMLTYLDYGFYVGEKVYYYDKKTKKLRLKKIAQRLQSTIWKWNVEDDGGIISVTQQTQGTDGMTETNEMGIDRLVVLTFQKEAANWEGQSILRSAYGSYYMKDKLIRIDAMAHERHGMGIPKIKVPASATGADYKTCRGILENLRSHEKGYVLEPEGFDFSMVEFKTNMRDPLPSINYHDQRIAGAVLGNFLSLGAAQSGSRALGDTQGGFFLAALQAYTTYICDIVNRHIIRQLVDINYGPQERYPELRATPTGGQDIEKMAKALMMMTQNDLLYIDKTVVEQLHRFLGLPQPDYEEGEFISERSKQKQKAAASTGVKTPKKPAPAAGPSAEKPKPKPKAKEAA